MDQEDKIVYWFASALCLISGSRHGWLISLVSFHFSCCRFQFECVNCEWVCTPTVMFCADSVQWRRMPRACYFSVRDEDTMIMLQLPDSPGAGLVCQSSKKAADHCRGCRSQWGGVASNFSGMFEYFPNTLSHLPFKSVSYTHLTLPTRRTV